MQPLYRDPYFTFQFADNRIIPRFHLEEVAPATPVSVIKIDAQTKHRLGLLTTGIVGIDGWVELREPITMNAGGAFVAVPTHIRADIEKDHDAIRSVNRNAFSEEAEARLVDALRAHGCARVSLVAETEDQVIGHILFSDLAIVGESATIQALALAPMAVLPAFQRQGIGSALVRHGLAACKELGHRIVVVLGHPNFYPRFGFSAKRAKPLISPYGSGPSHMAMELAPGALDGVAGTLEYAPPFLEL